MSKLAHYYFYADANARIGGGHLKRSLHLAKAVCELQKEADVTFIHTDVSVEFAEQLSYPHWTVDAVDWTDFWERTADLDSKMILFDTDRADIHAPAMQTEWGRRGWQTAYFTVNDSRPYNCDFLINPNILAFSQNYTVAAHTQCLFGPEYFIYPPAFRNLSPRSPQKKVERIFINFGNADPQGYTLAVLKWLVQHPEFLHWEWEVVLGAAAPHLAEVSDLVSKLSNKVHLHRAVQNIERIMKTCQLAICSPGATFWELALLGVRSILLVSSEREQAGAEVLAREAYAELLTPYEQGFNALSSHQLIRYLTKVEAIAPRLKALQQLINPQGIQAIAEALTTKRHGQTLPAL